jgi:2-C-methyl-D-erythritol 4-phosphate cytidylyltransferase
MAARAGKIEDADRASRVGAIVVAAGSSRRMKRVDKTLMPLLGRSLILHSLQVFNDSPLVAKIVLVVSEGNAYRCRQLVARSGFHKVVGICVGGERRQDSVRLGLDLLGETDWIIEHDGARPCVDGAMIETGLIEAQATGAAVAAVPVKDTIKAVGPGHVVTQTLEREGLWLVQTPQVFRTDLLVAAHEEFSEDVTDDASMVERCGHAVKVFMGSHDNVKVTVPEDISIAEAILRGRGRAVPGLAQ